MKDLHLDAVVDPPEDIPGESDQLSLRDRAQRARKLAPTQDELRARAERARPMEEFEAEQDSIIHSTFADALPSMSLADEGDRRAAIIKLTEASGAPADFVEKNFDDFQASWAASNFDPRRWRTENPVLAQEVLRKPLSGKLIVGDAKVSNVSRALRTGHANKVLGSEQFHNELERIKNDAEMPWYDKLGGVMKLVLGGAKVEERPSDSELRAAEIDLARMEGDLPPEQVTYWQDARAQQGQRNGALTKAWLTMEDAQLGVERSLLGAQIARSKLLGEDTWHLEKKLADMNNQLLPRDYQAGGWEQVLLDIGQALPSQWDMVKGGGAGLAVGTVGGAAVGYFTPFGPLKGAQFGGSLLGKAGAAAASFNLTFGDAYLGFRNEGYDDETAIGAAAVEAALSTFIETASFSSTLKAFGPVGEAFQKGEGRAFVKAMLADTTRMQIIKRAGKEWAKSGGTEFLEEFGQTLLHPIVGYGFESAQAGEWKETDAIQVIKNLDEAVEAGRAGGVAGLGMASPGPGLALVQHRILRGRAEISADRVRAIAAAAELPISEADPEAMARIIAEETKTTGQPVTHLYASPEKVQEVLEANGVSPEELLGEEGAKALKEAVASGAEMELPVVQYFQAAKRNKKATGELNRHLTTERGLPPPSTTDAEHEVIKAEAADILEDMKADEQEKENPEGEKKERKARKASKAEQELGDKLVEQLVKTGYTDDDAKAAAALFRAVVRTQAKVEAAHVGEPKKALEYEDKLFGNYLLMVGREGGAQPATAVAQKMRDLFDLVQMAETGPRPLASNPQNMGDMVSELMLDSIEKANLEFDLYKDNPKFADAKALIDRAKAEGFQFDPDTRPMTELGRAVIDIEKGEIVKEGGTPSILHRLASRFKVFQRAHHGAAYPWEGGMWDPDKVLSGEGTLEEAWGLYLSKSKKVAKGYAKMSYDGVVYEFDIPNNRELLDFRLPMSQQPKYVKDKLRAAGLYDFDKPDTFEWRNEIQEINGEGWYRKMWSGSMAAFDSVHTPQTEKAAKMKVVSQKLLAAGIKGAVYEDEAVNYVIWDPASLRPTNPALFQPAFHGTGVPINAFDMRFANDGVNGLGHYFTTDQHEADQYRKIRSFGKEGDGEVYYVDLPEDSEMLSLDGWMSDQHPEVLSKLRRAGLLAADDEAGMSGLLWYRELQDRLGGAREATEALAAAGVPGGYSTMTGDGFEQGRKHFVMYDDSRIKVDMRHYAGSTYDYNGYMERVDNLFAIMLSPHANMSTFLHEAGHTFFEMMKDLASKEATNPRIKEDYAAALKFMGMTEKQMEARKLNISAIHAKAKAEGRTLTDKELDQVGKLVEPWERFARGFEAYLREGNAPSSKLRRAFMRFQKWLTDVYQKVTELNIELNDEIRGVFDRLLATDQEIRNARRKMGLQPFWASPEDMARDLGREVTPQEWVEYTDAQKEATSHPVMAGNFAALKDELKEKTQWWKNEESMLYGKYSKEYEALPERQAWLFMLGRGLDDTGRAVNMGSPTLLNRAQVEAIIGSKKARKFKGVMSSDGIDINAYATDFGFATGADMLKAILALPQKKKYIQDKTKAEMRDRFPGLLEDREKLRAVVEKGLHSGRTIKWLMLEIKALRERVKTTPQPHTLQSGKNKGKTVMRGHFKYPRLESIREAARLMAQDRKVGNLNSHAILQTERRLHEKAMKAAARGDWEQALVLKYKQVFNAYLWSAVNEARTRREKFLDVAKTLRKDKVRSRIGKGATEADRTPLVLLDGIDTVMEALGLREPVTRERPAASTQEVVAALQTIGNEAKFDVGIIEGILHKPRSYKELTVTQMDEVYKYFKQLKKVGDRNATSLLEDGTRIDQDNVVTELVKDAVANRIDRGPDPGEDSTLKSKLDAFFNNAQGSFLKIETMVHFLSGGDINSMWYRAVLQPIMKAKARKADLMAAVVKPIIEALENIPDDMRAKFNQPIDGKALFPNHRNDVVGVPGTVKQLVMLVLNSGNPTNSLRLQEGRGISKAEVMSAAAKHLDKATMDWIQSIWDASEPLWPLMRDLEERDTGIAPEKVQPSSFDTPWGTYKGGYFHLTYRWKVESAVNKNAPVKTVEEVLDPHYIRPTTPHSHLKQRVKNFNGVIELDNLNVIYNSLTQSVHDISYREALKSVAALLLHPDVDDNLRRRLGYEMAPQMLQWLRDIGLEHSPAGTVHASWANRAMRHLRGGMSVAYLGHRPSVWTGDVGNMLKVLNVGDVTAKSWWGGVTEFLSNPFESRAEVLRLSGEMRVLTDDTVREFQNEIDKLQTKNPLKRFGPLALYVETAFTMQKYISIATSTPIWLAAYRQKLAELGQHPDAQQQAVKYADVTVRLNFSSHNIADQAGFMRDPGYMGASTIFFSYLSAAYQQQARMADPFLQSARSEGLWNAETAKRLGKFIAKGVAFAMIHNVLEEFLMGRGPEAADGEDPASRWATWFSRKMLLAHLTTVPVLTDLAQYLEAAMLGRQINPRAAPLASFMLDLGKAGQAVINATTNENAEFNEKQFMALFRVGGVMFKYPIFPVTGSGQYLIDLSQGDLEADDLFDITSGLFYGQRKGGPQTPFRPLTPVGE